MKKEFNTTGTCFPAQHYIMDNRAKLNNVLDLVERGKYFTINRPRQYGKTTTLFALEEVLKKSGTYLPIRLNFQGIDQKWHESDSAFAQMFTDKLASFLEMDEKVLYKFMMGLPKPSDMDGLSAWITKFAHQSPKKPVLLIDEVDASCNFMPFLNFLGMLRTKYLDRYSPQHTTFHSIVLVGVHDVKSLKYRLRDQEVAQYNSPWNIAAEFDVEMEFNPQEIAPMLEEYSRAENVPMDIPTIAERLYYHTDGYPFLASRLCQIIAEKILPKKDKKTWELDDVELAVQKLLSEDNTNFDSLFKNLENNPDLMELVLALLLDGEVVPFNIRLAM